MPPHAAAASARPAAGLARAFKDVPWSDLGVPVAVLVIIVAMITPLPPILIDILISANITVSVIVLLVSIYIVKPVDFSLFPTTLLLLTLFRLALNISSSRLILLNGNTGTEAAGGVIEAFGSFVVGGNYIIGAVIFLVLVAIQYVVINHGAVRISEVTARFTLDAMPGKQMSIDSDLNAGLIDEAEARKRRRMLAAEAEFYGAMDGASRFTQRDAVASILITAINIIAGFLIGVLQHGMDLKRAIETYTVLTIGDGLVTVIPALMISISGGLIVTRAGSETQIGSEYRKQFFAKPEPLFLASGVLVALGAFPGMPALPFLLMSGGVGFVAWRIHVRLRQPASDAIPPPPAARENVESLLRVEPLAVEVGLGLVRLVEGGAASPLLKRIAAIRKQLAGELGYVLPPVRVTDNLSLKAREYVILLKGVELSRYELPQGFELAIPNSSASKKLEGSPTKEPAFGIPALWISADSVDIAQTSGSTVVDPVSVLGTHFAELIRAHAHELLSRQDAKRLLDRLSEENPKLVEDVVPKLLPLSLVQRVFQNLLRERVSIRDTGSILEAVGEAAAVTRNPVLLTEYARQAIRRMVIKPYLNARGDLPAYFIDGVIEHAVESAIEHSENLSHLNLPPQQVRDIAEKIQRTVTASETPVVALTSSGARFFLRQITETGLPNLYYLSHNEVPAGIKAVSRGLIQ